MNAPLTNTAPAITTLADKAMLVRLKISKWTPYAYDIGATIAVELANGVRNAGRFNKHLMKGCARLTEVNAAYNDVYQYHIRNTVPWLDDGVRMLPSNVYFDYTTTIRELIDKADTAAKQLEAEWPQLVANDVARLGPLGDPNDYPTSIVGMFRADVRFQPVPQEGDFRVEISDDDRASLAASIRDAENSVTAYLIGEMCEPIRRLAARCDAFGGAKGERWHHSLVTNVAELTDRLPRLNINKCSKIDALIRDIRDAVKPYLTNPDTLKDDPLARVEAKSKMDQIMQKMGAFMSGVGNDRTSVQ